MLSSKFRCLKFGANQYYTTLRRPTYSALSCTNYNLLQFLSGQESNIDPATQSFVAADEDGALGFMGSKSAMACLKISATQRLAS